MFTNKMFTNKTLTNKTLTNKAYRKLTCKSLGARFILVVVIILAATMSFTTILNYRSQRQQFIDQLLSRGNMLGNFVALISPDAVLGYDFVLVDEYMREISRQDDVLYSVMVSPESIPISSYLNRDNPYIAAANSNDLMETVTFVNQYDDVIPLQFSIVENGELLGILKLGLTTARLDQLTHVALRDMLLQNGAIIILLSLAIYFVFRQNALRPIRDLIHSSQRVAGGDLDHRANVMSVDELGTLALSFNEMTESLKASYLKLNKTNESLQAATKAKSDFLANMSHEIRTPLTAIMGFAESLLDPAIPVMEKTAAIKTIIRNGDHLQRVINDILDISKIEADKLEVEQTQVSPIELLRDVEDLVGMQARGKNLEFGITYHFPVPLTIRTDPLRLKQVLINLCGNAIKFTERGKIAIDVRCDIARECMSFSVSDTGIGLKPEQLESVFKAFTQADTSITRKYGGTGLGLHLSQRLTAMLGGTIHVQSAEGVGSCFTATIATGPLQGVERLNDVNELQIMGRQDSATPQDTRLIGDVLLAEDTVDIQRMIELFVKKTGAKLTIADNGQVAVNEALAGHFDLVLMDMHMPVMNGADAVRTLRARGYSKPVVALTASVLKQDISYYKDIGCDEFLAKPIGSEAILEVLKRYLRVDSREPQHLPQPEGGPSQASPSISDKLAGKILLVEDTEDNQRLIKIFLKKAGLEIHVVENGREAIDELATNRYDLILMDMQMPVMGGLEATKILRSQGCTIPIIALSANALDQDIANYFAAGCDDFVAKPIRRELLVDALSKHLTQTGQGKDRCNSRFCQLNDESAKQEKLKKITGMLPEAPQLQALAQLLRQINEWYSANTERGEAPDIDVSSKQTPAKFKPILSSVLGEDPEFDSIIEYYVNNLPDTLARIDRAFGSKDWSALQQEAHKLKGSGAGFGYAQLTELATQLESATRGENISDAGALINELHFMCHHIQAGWRQNEQKQIPTEQWALQSHQPPTVTTAEKNESELRDAIDFLLYELPTALENINRYREQDPQFTQIVEKIRSWVGDTTSTGSR